MNNDLKKVKSIFMGMTFIVSILLLLAWLLMFFSSCTLNVIMTHTEGSATDVVDSNPSTKADVSPDISIPIIP